jgi:membrane protein DedA with SNARE-associated domain
MTDSTGSLAYLAGLFGVIAVGTVVPVLPSGAPLTAAAALAGQEHLLTIGLVLVIGAAGSYAGDLATYAALWSATKRAGEKSGRLTRWLEKERHGRRIQRAEHQLEQHELRTLLLSRLVPGGRVPVLITAALGGYSWRRYAMADIAAASLWSAYYTASGVAGRALFPKPWEGVVASVALVLLISLASNEWSRRRTHPAAPRP